VENCSSKTLNIFCMSPCALGFLGSLDQLSLDYTKHFANCLWIFSHHVSWCCHLGYSLRKIQSNGVCSVSFLCMQRGVLYLPCNLLLFSKCCSMNMLQFWLSGCYLERYMLGRTSTPLCSRPLLENMSSELLHVLPTWAIILGHFLFHFDSLPDRNESGLP